LPVRDMRPTQEMNGKRFDFSDQAHLRLASGGAV
jgi:hypothetical protein